MRQNGFNADAKNDPSQNPYLQHHYPITTSEESLSDRVMSGLQWLTLRADGGGLTNSKRHKTTTKETNVLEDGPLNPFTARPFTPRYLSILKTRRGLPVHAQRWALPNVYFTV
jgi:pre-mRNA-splicing factor ATP-dependent RNA helicase DHX15/PRP43